MWSLLFSNCSGLQRLYKFLRGHFNYILQLTSLLQTHLFLSQFLAPPLLTYLMAFIVPTRRTVTTIVLPLTPDTFTAPLSLLLHLFVLHVTAANLMLRSIRMRDTTAWYPRRTGCHAVVFKTGGGTRNGCHLTGIDVHGSTIALRRAFEAGGANFPTFFFTNVATRGRTAPEFGPVQTVVKATGVVHEGVLELGGMEALNLLKKKLIGIQELVCKVCS